MICMASVLKTGFAFNLYCKACFASNVNWKYDLHSHMSFVMLKSIDKERFVIYIGCGSSWNPRGRIREETDEAICSSWDSQWRNQCGSGYAASFIVKSAMGESERKCWNCLVLCKIRGGSVNRQMSEAGRFRVTSGIDELSEKNLKLPDSMQNPRWTGNWKCLKLVVSLWHQR